MKTNPYISGVTIRIALGNLHQPDEWWVTREGRRMLVDKMSETHVRNTLRLILRRRREQRQGIDKKMREQRQERMRRLLIDAELALLEMR